ncbi:glycosyltransferase [Tepidamorphus sp. 3E244]|uniref:glycosyltransferase n=1 Tax=Tepidamorphus sp. 3E244 TaxID=3385498 RepID=UPI0038FC644D
MPTRAGNITRLYPRAMIPRIIHQTWRDAHYSSENGSPESWRENNPGWEYRLWTDDELEWFVSDTFPRFAELYHAYPNPVQRADLARYMLLKTFGGVYADMDTDCLAPLDPIADEDRVVVCEEPRDHWQPSQVRGMSLQLFNGTFASPQGHPLWDDVLERAWRMRMAISKDVLDSTGPLVFAAAVAGFAKPDEISVNSCHLFSPNGKDGKPASDVRHGDYGHLGLSRHNWAGSWFSDYRAKPFNNFKGRFRKRRAQRDARRYPSPEDQLAKIDRERALRPLPAYRDDAPPSVAIFVPVRNAAHAVRLLMQQVARIDYPRDRLRVVFGEGPSTDASAAILQRLKERHEGDFAGFDVLTFDGPDRRSSGSRWLPSEQLVRRAAIAKARNRLLREGLRDTDERVLWIDADVCEFSPGILRRLLCEDEKIVTPNCVLEWNAHSFDLNAFLQTAEVVEVIRYKHYKHGLMQPPPNDYTRRHLHELRYLERIPLTGVGGTMLLVDAELHRAGLVFPETPYRELIETEAFGVMANDLGIVPIGLPNVEIRHVSA